MIFSSIVVLVIKVESLLIAPSPSIRDQLPNAHHQCQVHRIIRRLVELPAASPTKCRREALSVLEARVLRGLAASRAPSQTGASRDRESVDRYEGTAQGCGGVWRRLAGGWWAGVKERGAWVEDSWDQCLVSVVSVFVLVSDWRGGGENIQSQSRSPLRLPESPIAVQLAR